jgi:hypothetical protein
MIDALLCVLGTLVYAAGAVWTGVSLCNQRDAIPRDRAEMALRVAISLMWPALAASRAFDWLVERKDLR